MTVKELIMNVSFDELLPYLKEYEKKHLDSIYGFREAYDFLRAMEPNKDFQGTVEVAGISRTSGKRFINVNYLDGDLWENGLAKEIVFKEESNCEDCVYFHPNDKELAMRCLWELTFYGFSQMEIHNNFEQMLNRRKPTKHYETALDNLSKSIWKHQIPRKLRYMDEEGRLFRRGNPCFEIECDGIRKKRMNRSKRKRQYRQNNRKDFLKIMAARESLIAELTVPGSSLTYKDMEFLYRVNYGVRYDYNSVTNGKDRRLDYIFESMTKYQSLDWGHYDSAVVFIGTSAKYPIDEAELSLFKDNMYKMLGYKNMLYGHIEEENDCTEAKVILLLNKM